MDSRFAMMVRAMARMRILDNLATTTSSFAEGVRIQETWIPIRLVLLPADFRFDFRRLQYHIFALLSNFIPKQLPGDGLCIEPIMGSLESRITVMYMRLPKMELERFRARNFHVTGLGHNEIVPGVVPTTRGCIKLSLGVVM